MSTHKSSILASLLLTLILPLSVPGQEQASGPSPQQIRARKLVAQWEGKTVLLILDDGQELYGQLLRTDYATLTLKTGKSEQDIPISSIDAAVLRPGIPELALSAIAAMLGGAFGYAAVILVSEDAGNRPALTGATLAAVAAGIWGWRSFFRVIRYDLKEVPQ